MLVCFSALALLFAAPVFSQPETPPVMDEHLAYWTETVTDHSLELVRKNAARTLGIMGKREAVPSLVAALKDPYHGVRAESARALGQLGDERALGPLENTIRTDSDKKVRKLARVAVERIQAYLEYQEKKQDKEEARLLEEKNKGKRRR